MEQTWRVFRIFSMAAVSSAGAAWADLTSDEQLIVGSFLTASCESVYRAVFPVGHRRLIHAIAEVVARATETPNTVVNVNGTETVAISSQPVEKQEVLPCPGGPHNCQHS